MPELPKDYALMGLKKGPLRYVPVQPIPRPGVPTQDNYARFKLSNTNFKMPRAVDLSKVKILWSQEM